MDFSAFHDLTSRLGIDAAGFTAGLRARRKVDRSTAGWCLELVGPSGVGKSATLSTLDPAIARRWLTRHEISRLPAGRRVPPLPGDAADRDLHARLLFDRIAHLRTNGHDSAEVARFLSYMSLVVLNDLKIRQGAARAGALLDEGLCQIFGREIAALEAADFAGIMQNRGLVALVTRDPRRVVDQIENRAALSYRRTIHHGRTPEDLAEVARLGTALALEIAGRAAEFGAPTMVLHAEDGLARNAARLAGFTDQIARISPAVTGEVSREPVEGPT